MKTFESIVKTRLKAQIATFEDNLQFAYKEKRGVEDAIITLVHKLVTHLDKSNTYARLLFVDFSSAFNTIQPHILIRKLIDMGVNSYLILWLHSFLTERTQKVFYQGNVSTELSTNTGAPQGRVLSPILFTLYTSDCRSWNKTCSLLKYADDTVLCGLLQDNEQHEYFDECEKLVKYCDEQNLVLNIKKTKELIIDFRKSHNTTRIQPLIINNQQIETVSHYKYLGTTIDNKLNWSKNCHDLYVRCYKRLFYMRKLKEFKVDNTIVALFYKSVVESVLTFCAICWYSSLAEHDKCKLKRVVKSAKRMLGPHVMLFNLNESVNGLMLKKVNNIMDDNTHPLHKHFKWLPSRLRLSAPIVKTKRSRQSFVPASVHLYNSRTSRTGRF